VLLYKSGVVGILMKTRTSINNLQLLKTSELGSEAALGGGVDDEDDLALVFGQRLLSALLCGPRGQRLARVSHLTTWLAGCRRA
jgi:hypothetical protein